MDDQNKNLILATVLSFAVLMAWFVGGPILFPSWFPTEPAKQAQDLGAVPAGQTTAAATDATAAAPATGTAAGTTTGTEALSPDAAPAAPRIAVETPKLKGSISTLGGRIDELSLKTYRETVDPASPIVRLLTPVGDTAQPPYYAVFGWQAGKGVEAADVPGAKTQWQAPAGETLTPDHPVTLTWDNGKGLLFSRTISIDRDFMFSVADTVTNSSAAPVDLAPYGIIARHGLPKLENIYVVHEGPVRRIDGDLSEPKYAAMKSLPDFEGAKGAAVEATKDGWIGFTDHYWMTTLIPEQGKPWTAVEKYIPTADIYQTEVRQPLTTVAPGASATTTIRLFAGAKEWETIRAYQDKAGIAGFIDSIDWGYFFFLTKPIFWLLHLLHGWIGNMGLAIIALTFVLKLLVLPLAWRSYASMARMKELQPEMEALKERCGEDKQRYQREMMQLYKDKKINPAAGCLPILPQIPIFFSLYKVIFVTIELRQAPFFGWLKDLSAPDPSSIFNLFGLLPWDAPATGSTLHAVFIGLLPILLGISMWLQQKLNPAPTDPTQAQILMWMPWVFMFMLGRFASGLVLYWITNNTITFVQQYGIMWSHGKRPDIFGNMRSGRAAKAAATPAKAPANSPGKPKK
jgi:YidC/Oxa1 family membrane protein insertase